LVETEGGADIAKDVERVCGKDRLLVDIATASIDDPDGRNPHKCQRLAYQGGSTTLEFQF
jgi:hypothetical protein